MPSEETSPSPTEALTPQLSCLVACQPASTGGANPSPSGGFLQPPQASLPPPRGREQAALPAAQPLCQQIEFTQQLGACLLIHMQPNKYLL